MKKLYLVMLPGLLGFNSQAQQLADVLCNLNTDYANITALVPSMYTFIYDGGGSNINDGGGDMYDGGNYLNTNLQSAIVYSDNTIISSAAFGTTGQYFTRQLPGLFVMAADLDGVSSFSISGNVGADGGGSTNTHVFTTSSGGITYDAYVKRIYAAGDPSVNQVLLIPQDGTVTHNFATNTDDDFHELSGLNSTTRIYYFLVSSSSGGYIDNPTIESITNEFLQSAVGGSGVTAVASGTDLCYGDSLLLYGMGGTGSYTWDNGVTDSVEFVPAIGTVDYTVSAVATNGCVQSSTVSVVVKPAPIFSLSTGDEIAGGDGDVFVTLIDGTFPFTYDWDNDGTGDFDDPQNLIGVGPGTYTLVVSQANGCTATATATVNSQVGLSEGEVSFTAYPNPVTENLIVELEGEFVYQVTDINGRVLISNNGQHKEVISFTELASGTYFISIMAEGLPVMKQTIIKN